MQFIKDYRHDNVLRASLNALTRKVYRFDFEQWYQSGYWGNNCIPYSVVDAGRIVANVTANPLRFSLDGEIKRYVQLGTVMTDPAYRGQGLSRRLMEWALAQWQGRCDLIYLFANDRVLEFYPKFGFQPKQEYQASKALSPNAGKNDLRRLDLSAPEDCRLLYETARHAAPLARPAIVGGEGLTMFYCKCFPHWDIGKRLYHLPQLRAIAAATYQEDALILHDLFCPQQILLDDAISLLALPKTRRVTLEFMPKDASGWEIAPFHEEDSTLFVQGKDAALFDRERLRFPTLTHT